MYENFDILIKNAYILTINSNFDIIENGFIGINKDKIAIIGHMSEFTSALNATKIVDAGGKLVMPGLINTHTHLAMTLFRGIADDIKLMDWLYKYIFPAEKKCVTPETVEVGVKLAIIELIKSGTTCFNDMYYFEDITAQVAIKSGMRGVVGEGIIDEGVANSANASEGLEYTAFLIDKYKNNDLIDVAVAVHAPYSASAETMQKAYALAQKNDVLFHIHLAETKWELEKFLSEYGMSSVEYVDKLGILGNKTVAAHGVWLNDKEIDLFATRGTGVAHNPECNMKIASGVAPIPKMLVKGVKVGLGTDGTASNNNLNMFQEMRTMALLHKLNSNDPTVIPARKAIEIATIGGAKLLHKEKEIGSLEIGKKADMIFIDLNHANTTPYYNIYSLLVYSLNGTEIADVMINGKFVMKDKQLLTIDEKEVYIKAKEISSRIKSL